MAGGVPLYIEKSCGHQKVKPLRGLVAPSVEQPRKLSGLVLD
jgi:hypothetical protein